LGAHRRDDHLGRHTLRPTLERLLDERLRRETVLSRAADDRVHTRKRRGRHVTGQTPVVLLGQEEEREQERHHSSSAGRTTSTAFCRPKPSSTYRPAMGSATQRSPSTTNMYSCCPAGRMTRASQTPSWSSSDRGVASGRQSLHAPTTATECASGKRATNCATPSSAPRIGSAPGPRHNTAITRTAITRL